MRGFELTKKISSGKKKNRPHPARMPTLAEREELNYLDPKTFYTKGPGAPPPPPEAKEEKSA
jgi:hypothetical protein